MSEKKQFCAPEAQDVLLNGPIAVAGTATAYSETWVSAHKKFFGVELQFSSDTNVNCKVELEQSNYAVAAQGAADPNFVVAIDTIATIIDEDVHLFPIAPVVAVYARFKITGLTGNGATTKLVRANWVVVEV